MMGVKEKIKIEEFDNKKFKIRFVEEDDNRKAILTHYLHNYKFKFLAFFCRGR